MNVKLHDSYELKHPFLTAAQQRILEVSLETIYPVNRHLGLLLYLESRAPWLNPDFSSKLKTTCKPCTLKATPCYSTKKNSHHHLYQFNQIVLRLVTRTTWIYLFTTWTSGEYLDNSREERRTSKQSPSFWICSVWNKQHWIKEKCQRA